MQASDTGCRESRIDNWQFWKEGGIVSLRRESDEPKERPRRRITHEMGKGQLRQRHYRKTGTCDIMVSHHVRQSKSKIHHRSTSIEKIQKQVHCRVS